MLAIAVAYPLGFRVAKNIGNYVDPLLDTCIVAWNLHALTTEPMGLYHANSFHSIQHTLAYSENHWALPSWLHHGPG